MMAMRNPRPAPSAAPPQLSLLVSAANVDETDETWLNGIEYEPSLCNSTTATHGMRRCGEPGPAAKDFETDDDSTGLQWDPYVVWAGDRCTAAEWQNRQFEARARTALTVCEAQQIEREFWRGAIADADGLPNIWLADASAPNFVDLGGAGDNESPDCALAALQEIAGDAACGGPAFIHAPRRVATAWQRLQLVRREGRRVLDLYDNVVVPGVGYDGSGPDGVVDATGAVAWAYVTGPVEIRRSAIRLLPDAGDYSVALNRRSNDIEWRAERAALASWDGCLHAGVRVAVDCGDAVIGS